MISAIKVDLEDNGLGGVHHRTLRSLGWLNYKTSNGSKPKRCQHTTMESFNSRFKGENKSLFHEAANIWELGRLIAQQIEYHNTRRRHSRWGTQRRSTTSSRRRSCHGQPLA